MKSYNYYLLVAFFLVLGCSSKSISTIENRNINGESTIEYFGHQPFLIPIDGFNSLYSKIVYPKEALENGIEGRVFIEIVIDSIGVVKEARVVTGIGYGLDEAALNAVLNTKFESSEPDIKVYKCNIPITFKLN